MESDLAALEERIRQTVLLAGRLRAENVDLRQRIANLETDNKRLAEKVDNATARLEALLKQIPE